MIKRFYISSFVTRGNNLIPFYNTNLPTLSLHLYLDILSGL